LRLAENGEPLLVQDAMLPWEITGPCDTLAPPPAAHETPNPDPIATLPWEPIDPGEELPPLLARHHDEELPDWLATDEAEAAPDGGAGALISMAELEALAAAELGQSQDSGPDVDDPTQHTVWGPTRAEPNTEAFDPEATVIRLPTQAPGAGPPPNNG
jgi:hypothetical protein